MMTYKLYEWQMNKFRDPDLARVLNLAKTIEMPLVKVIAEMELKGMEVDLDYAYKDYAGRIRKYGLNNLK